MDTRFNRLGGVAGVLVLAAMLPGCVNTGVKSDLYAHTRIGFSTPVGYSAAGNYLAAQHAGTARDNQAAAAYFERALNADPHNAAILERAFLLAVTDGDIPQAADLARPIIALESANRMARLVLSVDNLKAGRYAAAGKEIDAAAREDASDAVWTIIRAWAHAGGGNIDQARTLFSSQTARSNLGAFALYQEALLLDVAGQRDEADKAYRTAVLAAEGRSARLLEAYGKFLLRNDRAADAVTLYETYLKALPGNRMVEGLLASARDSRASRRALVTNPAEGAAEALYGIAAVLASERSGELPLVYLQLALYLRPDLDIGLALRGELFEVSGEWEKAIRSFAAIPKGSPLEPLAAVAIARDLARLDKYDDAAQLMRSRLSTDPDNLEALVVLGDLERAQEKWPEAAASYGRALETAAISGRDRWQILYARGVALERAGNWPQAEAHLQEALELQPSQPQILNYLGYSWVDRGENLEEALVLIDSAVAASPEDGYIVDSLGWAYYRLGDFQNATKFLERAVELRPSDPVINDHLGDAYWRVGRRHEAKFQWNHALTFRPTPKEAERIARKLETGLEDSGEPPLVNRTSLD